MAGPSYASRQLKRKPSGVVISRREWASKRWHLCALLTVSLAPRSDPKAQDVGKIPSEKNAYPIQVDGRPPSVTQPNLMTMSTCQTSVLFLCLHHSKESLKDANEGTKSFQQASLRVPT